IDCAGEPQWVFLRAGSHKRETDFGDELRQGYVEHFERRCGAASAGQEWGADAGRESRVPGSGRIEELDVPDLRSADETFLCDGTCAVRHFCEGAAALRSGTRVLRFRVFSER